MNNCIYYRFNGSCEKHSDEVTKQYCVLGPCDYYEEKEYPISVLVGKRIKTIDADGYGVCVKTEDRYKFGYSASDGGYSDFAVYRRADNKP